MICWTQENLAEAAGVSRSTIKDFEAGRHDLQRATESQILSALRDAGINLIWREDGTVGATIRLSPASCGGSS
ncbi:transcriptional regulator [Limoniibacter endophyticus]|uniref:Transcriptional regulator n=1 Tax=Limoniibacter endophyticus TaxID=1565040 RepID=A0A8J3DIH8_9HYPH|nr:transcriptional regulator [Limoniibacter endophyticus]